MKEVYYLRLLLSFNILSRVSLMCFVSMEVSLCHVKEQNFSSGASLIKL